MYASASSPDSHYPFQINTTAGYKNLLLLFKGDCAWSHFSRMEWRSFTLCTISNINRHGVDVKRNDLSKSLLHLKHFHFIVFLCVTSNTYQRFCWPLYFFPSFFIYSPFSGYAISFLSVTYWVSSKSASKPTFPDKRKGLNHMSCLVRAENAPKPWVWATMRTA